MDKILQISYQGRSLSFEESAYLQFQEYEATLHTYFLKEEGGEEIFQDLQNRMAEILEQQNKDQAITSEEVQYIISIIGQPKDFDDASENSTEGPRSEKEPASKEAHKLFRDKKNRMIAGVCSGIAHYFNIDPIAVRLAFVIFALFNLATFFALNLSVVGYIVLWAILTPKQLEPGLTSRLFRNPNDKVLGGVCSGLAQFFNTETWIVRLIMVAPLILSMVSSNRYHMPFHIIGDSLASLVFIIYVLLWFITPIAKSSTDYMLLKGEPINLNTLQNSTSKQNVMKQSGLGINKFLKMIAYFFLVIIIFSVVISIAGIGLSAFFASDIAEMILFSATNKTMSLIGLILVIGLPIIASIIWLYRRISGYGYSGKSIRITFVGLWMLGFLCIAFVSANLIKRMHTFSKSSERMTLPVVSDTLIVDTDLLKDSFNHHTFFELNNLNRLVKHTNQGVQVQSVRLLHEESPDQQFHVLIERGGFGAGQKDAARQIARPIFSTSFSENKLMMPPYMLVSAKEAYQLQFVTVTVFVPKGKTMIVSGRLKEALKHDFHFGDNAYEWNWDDESWSKENDEIIHMNGKPNNAENVDIQSEQVEIQEATQALKKTEEESLAEIREKEAELAKTKEEARKKMQEAADNLKKTLHDTMQNKP